MTERELYPAELDVITASASVIKVARYIDPEMIKPHVETLQMYLRSNPEQTKQLIQAILGFVPEDER